MGIFAPFSYLEQRVVTPSGPSPVTDSLEQWLDAENPGGSPSTTWTDTQGNFDGTPSGVTYVSGTPSYYDFPFSGTNKVDCGTSIPSFMQGTGTKNYTIQYWIYLDAHRGNMGFFQFGTAATAGRELNMKTRGNAIGQMRSEYGSTSARNFGTPYLATGTWYMITVTQDSSTAGDFNYFVDDTTEFGKSPALTQAMNLQSTGKFQIGLQESDRLDGRIGQWLLYSKTLSTSEIQQNYDYFKSTYGKS